MATGGADTATRMAEAASAWLADLSDGQRSRAVLPFTPGGERTRWFYTPSARAGLPFGAMTSGQQQLAHRLLASGLSSGGYATAAMIMGLENVLDARESWRTTPYPGDAANPRGRDPLAYYVAVHGEPGADMWGWTAGGHHLSLTHTVVAGEVAAPAPLFFGSHPAEVRGVGSNGLRLLAGEEDLGLELLHALDSGQRALAVISPRAPFDLVQSNRPRVEDEALPRDLWAIFSTEQGEARRAMMDRMRASFEEGFTEADRSAHRYEADRPKGLPAARMTAAQRSLLEAVVGQYIGRLPDEVAEREWAAIRARGVDGIHFAWAGGAERKQGHYYRLQGPRFLVEYDNVQDTADHVHAVWRDPEGDFGADLLAQHYAASH